MTNVLNLIYPIWSNYVILTDLDIILFYYHRDNPKFTNQSPQVANVPIRPWTLGWWVFHLLRELGGHGHLCLRTHVSVLYLWHQAEEDVQRLLSNLQKANQRHNQDLSEHIRGKKGLTLPQQNPRVRGEKKYHISGNVNFGTFLKCFHAINVN